MPKRKVVQKSIKNFCSEKEDESTEVESESTAANSRASKRSKMSAGKSVENVKKDKDEAKPVNKVDTDYGAINFECDRRSGDGKSWNFKISSWNVVSLKAVTNKNGMDFLLKESPDVMCFQETKCSEKKVPEGARVPGFHRYFASSKKEGYAGVALYSKEKPLKIDYGIGHKEHDDEGRVITAEYEKFYLVTAYVPNAGRGLVTLPKRLKWDPLFRAYLRKLDQVKPVILCGDLNVAHKEIDLKNPATNTRTAGFTQEERDGFTALLNDGFVDTFRHFYPEKAGAYTYWNYIGNARSRNAGWRLDYFVVSKRLLSSVCDNVIRSNVYGSDHCPITLFISV